MRYRKSVERRPCEDLTGKKFSRLTVIERCDSMNGSVWRCLCDCGNEVQVRGTELRNGTRKSCGCLRREARKRPTK